MGRLWILRTILVASPAYIAEEEVAALVVNYGSGMSFPGFAVLHAPRAVFPTIAAGRHAHVEKCADASGEHFDKELWALFL